MKRRVRAAEAEAEAAERAKAEKEKAEAKAKAKAVRAELEAPYRKWWSTLRKERNEKVGTPKTRGDVLAEIEAEESRFQSWMAVQMKSEAAKAQAANFRRREARGRRRTRRTRHRPPRSRLRPRRWVDSTRTR